MIFNIIPNKTCENWALPVIFQSHRDPWSFLPGLGTNTEKLSGFMKLETPDRTPLLASSDFHSVTACDSWKWHSSKAQMTQWGCGPIQPSLTHDSLGTDIHYRPHRTAALSRSLALTLNIDSFLRNSANICNERMYLLHDINYHRRNRPTLKKLDGRIISHVISEKGSDMKS